MNRRTLRTHRSFRVALAASLAALAGFSDPGFSADEPLDERTSYSYVRTVEGRATLASFERDDSETVDRHEPLLEGDRIQVERGARLEVVLADRNLLRVAGDSSLRLAQVAFSADSASRTTSLELERGEIALVVSDQALGDELPQVHTPAGTVFVHEPGRYRIFLAPTGALEVTVRDGFAELLTDRGSTVIRSGEEAWVGADRWRSVEIAAAGPLGALERWGLELEQGVDRASNRELRVAPYLAYSASDLDDYGSWIYVDATWYWRPRVTVGWRPYWDGRWIWTPTGLTWVSNEPWGWVPYHYGSWSVVPGYGWAWRPGRVYSPAWVYWYVGPSWTGWCPVGYYTSNYRTYWNVGFRFGVYGWSGGNWGLYADWNFLPTTRIDSRDGNNWRRTGSHLGRLENHPPAPGILTTDTGRLPRRSWERPDDVVRSLARRPTIDGVERALPEVTDFVARRPELPRDVAVAVLRSPTERSSGRRTSPLDPGADSTPQPSARPGWRDRTATTSGSRRLDGGEMFRPGSPTARPVDARRSTPNGNGRELAADPYASGATGIRPDDRQGWRQRQDVPNRAPGATSTSGWDRSPGATDRDSSPVARVVGGARRAEGGAGDSTLGRRNWRFDATGSGAATAPPSQPAAPRFGSSPVTRAPGAPAGSNASGRAGVVRPTAPGVRGTTTPQPAPGVSGRQAPKQASPPPPKSTATRGNGHRQGGQQSPPPSRRSKGGRDHD